MKKYLKTLLLSLVLLPVFAIFVGCSLTPNDDETNTPVEITSDMVSLSYYSVVYDGNEKLPGVSITYNGETFDATSYATYENNINAGTATVTITAPEENEYNLTGSITKNFTIQKQKIKVETLAELNQAIIDTDANHEIVLRNNISSEVKQGYIQPVLICPETKHYEDVTIDLNGYEIQTEVWIVKDYNKYYDAQKDEYVICGKGEKHTTTNTANVTFKNSKTTGYIGMPAQNYIGVDYGIILKINNGFTVTLNNIKSYGYSAGIYSNGNYEGDSTVTATNCHFEGIEKVGSLGAYLAANNTYNFENCSFKGYTSYYAKSGTHNLKTCAYTTIGNYAAKSFNGNGCIPTGSAIIADSSEGYKQTLVIHLYGGNFNLYDSKAYSIEEFSTYKTSVTPYATIYVHVNYFDNIQTIANDCAYENKGAIVWTTEL